MRVRVGRLVRMGAVEVQCTYSSLLLSDRETDALRHRTGFIRANDRAKAAYGGVIEAGKNGKSNVAPRPSKMGFRKNKFA
jgi:hypothetical protein